MNFRYALRMLARTPGFTTMAIATLAIGIGLNTVVFTVYGSFAFGLSAHSNVFRSFGFGGDGRIGLHGTNDSRTIGREVSHGCIRTTNPTILRLARVIPLGTPVEIVR